jgi:5-methyltetrahydrofolate--homocysteine methyltransferase
VDACRDYVGAFVVGIHGTDTQSRRFQDDHDDFSKIMVHALADRLAEAFAEKIHLDMRRDYWGYAADEGLTTADLLKIKYQGIRPAPGYPSQPDHTEKETMWKLMDVGSFAASGLEVYIGDGAGFPPCFSCCAWFFQAEKLTGVKLTESLAMWPAASVSALVFAHPDSSYFSVDKICKDQVCVPRLRSHVCLLVLMCSVVNTGH